MLCELTTPSHPVTIGLCPLPTLPMTLSNILDLLTPQQKDDLARVSAALLQDPAALDNRPVSAVDVSSLGTSHNSGDGRIR